MRNAVCRMMVVFAALFALLTGCQNETVSHDRSMLLRFSRDSVCFDTVFTGIGSSTQCVMVHNDNRNAVIISDVTMAAGGRYFHINLDGENQLANLHDIRLNGGDSLFLFIRVHIDPLDTNTPVLVEDTVRFTVNGNTQSIPLEAYGQDVHVIRTSKGKTEYTFIQTFENDKPYLVYDTLIAHGSLRFQEGATLYMHSTASIYAHGNVTAQGTRERPVRIMGDRLDRLFDSVPYRYASGQWGGLFLMHEEAVGSPKYQLDYTDILSGNIGLYCYSADKNAKGHLVLNNSRIHNHAVYGVALLNTDAEITNTEISNCAAYCLYMDGGKQTLTHNTIASFFGWPNSDLNIHTVAREDVAAVYINNTDKQQAITDVSIYNCIITGARKNNLVLATPLPDYYTGEIAGNYIKADSLHAAWCHDNVYANDSDTVFVNAYYKYKEYRYFDFRPDSVSPARGIGLPERAQSVPLDRDGHSRLPQPDAGCYQYVGP